MLNVHLSYNPPSYFKKLFLSGGYPRHFSCLKIFRAIVVPGGGCCKEVILQIILTPMGVLPNVKSCLRIEGDVTGFSIHAPRHSNSSYVQMVRGFIYDTIWTKRPHSPIHCC